MNSLHTVKEAAGILNVHPNTIYKGIINGDIPAYKLPRIGIRLKLEEIDEWASGHSTKKTQFVDILPKFDITLSGYDKLFLERRTEMNGTVRYKYPFGSVLVRETNNKEERYYIHYQVDGRRIRKALKGVRTRAEAVKILNAEVSDAQRGKYHFQRKKITFKEMADLYLEKYAKVKKRGWRRSDWVFLRRLKPYFGTTVLNRITSLMVEDYIAARKVNGLKNSSINRELSCLRKLFNVAIDWGYVVVNPVDKVKSLSEKGSMRERILTEDEEQRLLATASLHLIPMIMVGIYAGFRRGVILNLKWQNVDFEKGEIRTTYSKTGSGRAVPMTSAVISILNALKSQNGHSEYVFVNPETGMPYTDISRAFNGACRRADIKNLKFHDLRHTFGSRLVRNGANINLVKELMGHASILTTQRYLHSQVDEKRRAIESLASMHPEMWQTNGKLSDSDSVNRLFTIS